MVQVFAKPAHTTNSPMTAGVPADDPAVERFRPKNPDPGDAFRTVFTPALRTAIVEAAQRAYDIVQENHDPSLGYDAYTFGYNVYRIGCFQLGKVCERSPDKLTRVDELRMLVRFQTGGYTLGFYKVGYNETENIWESFPTSENGATSATSDGQIILSGLEDEMLDEVGDLRYAVVAHFGTAERGLRAVYLCIPVKTVGGKIVRWGYAEELYVADRAVGTVAAPAAALPAEETTDVCVPAEEPEADFVVRSKDGA